MHKPIPPMAERVPTQRHFLTSGCSSPRWSLRDLHGFAVFALRAKRAALRTVKYKPRPSDRKLNWAQRLDALGTKTGEKGGLGLPTIAD